MVARRDAEHRMSTMEERLQQLQEQVNQMKEMMLTFKGGYNLETLSSQHGSNSRQVICFPNHMYLSIALTIHHPFNKSVYILFGRTQEVNSRKIMMAKKMMPKASMFRDELLQIPSQKALQPTKMKAL